SRKEQWLGRSHHTSASRCSIYTERGRWQSASLRCSTGSEFFRARPHSHCPSRPFKSYELVNSVRDEISCFRMDDILSNSRVPVVSQAYNHSKPSGCPPLIIANLCFHDQ